MTSVQTKRFHKWLKLASPATRYLGARVESVLVPELERLGFAWPGDPRLLKGVDVLGRELELERASGSFVDTVTFNFDKYRRPRFQVHATRYAADPPNAGVRSCNLVASSRQYSYFWGIPWWYPTAWWSHRRTDRIIDSIERRLSQLDRFLVDAEAGPNISRPV